MTKKAFVLGCALATVSGQAWAVDAREQTATTSQEATAIDGRWQIDWERSEGMDAMMQAQGIPGAVRYMMRGAELVQTLVVSNDVVELRRKLPIGTVEETLIPDGVSRATQSRRGDHMLSCRWDSSGRLLVVRKFKGYRLEETWGVEGELLVVRVERHADDGVLTAIQRYNRIN